MYEKEVRKARKEAFKSSSALVNLQEELKTARNRYTLMRVEAEDERQKTRAKDQELSALQQQSMAIQEQLDSLRQQSLNVKEPDNSDVQQELEAVRHQLNTLKQQKETPSVQDPANVSNELREVSEELFILQQKLGKAERKIEKVEMQKQVVEEERDALKQSMEEEQIARCAAQGAIALPVHSEGTRASSGLHEKGRVESNGDQTGGPLQEIDAANDLTLLREEYYREKQMRLEAEEQVHLSLMECQFGCCSCRVAERQGTTFIYDGSLAQEIAALATDCVPKGNGISSKETYPERPRSHQGPSRSATPKLAMPQRPRSQQALGRQATPKLLDRPHSQQAGSRRTTPRPQQHNRSMTETTFKSARDLDLQARRSITQARKPSAAPLSPPKNRQPIQKDIEAAQKAEDDSNQRQADADNEAMLEIDFSSPYPHPPPQMVREDDTAHPIFSPPPEEEPLPPSPTMDFNFTEIIPNIPSIPPSSFPTPRPAAIANPPLPPQQQQQQQEPQPAPLQPSHTTQIPLKPPTPPINLFSPPPCPNTPSGITREAALEQIRARRGRARSYAASAHGGVPTPGKKGGMGMGMGIAGTPRREISAPAVRRF